MPMLPTLELVAALVVLGVVVADLVLSAYQVLTVLARRRAVAIDVPVPGSLANGRKDISTEIAGIPNDTGSGSLGTEGSGHLTVHSGKEAAEVCTICSAAGDGGGHDVNGCLGDTGKCTEETTAEGVVKGVGVGIQRTDTAVDGRGCDVAGLSHEGVDVAAILASADPALPDRQVVGLEAQVELAFGGARGAVVACVGSVYGSGRDEGGVLEGGLDTRNGLSEGRSGDEGTDEESGCAK